MTMKRQLAAILVPIYQKANHYGATPASYPTAKLVAFERGLLARGSAVWREQCERLATDTGVGGDRIYIPFRRYTFEYETSEALGEIAALALDLFGLEEVEVMRDPHTWRIRFDKEAAMNVAEGIDA